MLISLVFLLYSFLFDSHSFKPQSKTEYQVKHTGIERGSQEVIAAQTPKLPETVIFSLFPLGQYCLEFVLVETMKPLFCTEGS